MLILGETAATPARDMISPLLQRHRVLPFGSGPWRVISQTTAL